MTGVAEVTPTPSPSRAVGGRLLALDGMRGVAVLAVVGYHAGYVGSGQYGVDVFFVLSGFLITSLLLDERRTAGRIRLGRFYGRRALRLMPAATVMVVVVTVVGTLLLPASESRHLLPGALAVLTYHANWHAIDYQHMPLLAHAWSLSLEEQFYFTWPVALVVLLRRFGLSGRERAAAAVLCGLACASALWGALLYAHGALLPRVNALPDSHAEGLLLGCAVALLLAAGPLRGRTRAAVIVGGWAACVALPPLVAANAPPGVAPLGGYLAVSLGTGLVIASLSAGGLRPIKAVLSHRIFVGLGILSYSLYLVHLPVFQLLDRTSLSKPSVAVLGCCLSLALAVTLHRLVEKPFLALKQKRFGRDMTAAPVETEQEYGRNVAVPVLVAMPAGDAVGLAATPRSPAPEAT